jgi:CRP/FNR family cyclic AMP-dependent transcriptional regulator
MPGHHAPADPARLSFFRLLSDDLQQQLRRAAKVQRYADGAVLHACGDTSQSIGVVESGEVVLSNVTAGGRRIITTHLQPGDSFGEFTVFAGAPRYHDAEARGPTTVLYLGPAQFRQCMDESPALRDAVLGMLAQRLMWALDRIHDDFKLPLGKRLVKLILSRSRQDERGLRFVGSQTEMAEALGVSRIAVGQALRPLIKRGWLRTEYRAVVLLEPDSMNRWLWG